MTKEQAIEAYKTGGYNSTGDVFYTLDGEFFGTAGAAHAHSSTRKIYGVNENGGPCVFVGRITRAEIDGVTPELMPEETPEKETRAERKARLKAEAEAEANNQ